MLIYADFKARARKLEKQVSRACRRAGRDPSEVKLLAVTKTLPGEAVSYAARYGIPSVGENRVQEGAAKRAGMGADAPPIPWELIGPLQSNKAKLAAETFDRVQSVDREKIVRALDRHCADLGKRLRVLVQVNAGEDPKKAGVTCDAAPALVAAALAAEHLEVEGLMTIAPLSENPDVARLTFERLRSLRDLLAAALGAPLPVLSMGMSGDFEAAIAAGSTCIRVGTALFGPREA